MRINSNYNESPFVSYDFIISVESLAEERALSHLFGCFDSQQVCTDIDAVKKLANQLLAKLGSS